MEARLLRENALLEITKLVKQKLNIDISIIDNGDEMEYLFVIYFTKGLVKKYLNDMKTIIAKNERGMQKFMKKIGSDNPEVAICVLIGESLPLIRGMKKLHYYTPYFSKVTKMPLPFLNKLHKIRGIYKKCYDIIGGYNTLINLGPILKCRIHAMQP